MNTKNIIILIFMLGLTACNLPSSPAPIETPLPPTTTTTDIPTSTPEPTFTAPLVPTATPTATLTPSPTITPTFTVLRAEVLERANCRYGPGWPYLYKYGLLKGSNLEVIGRIDDANWIQLQAIGGDNPCWVKASLMEVKGDIFTVEPVYPDQAPLPVSPYYAPLSGVTATREKDQITISWTGQTLRAGDEENANSPLYVAEIWACENGKFKFTPYGLVTEELIVIDEAGCSEISHGQVYFAEKHGYAGPTQIEWPEIQ